MHDIRSLIGKLNFTAQHRSLGRTTRTMALKTVALFRGPAAQARSMLEGMAEIGAFIEAETGSWLEPEDIRDGKSGAFDACDLRHWLILAEKAGVAAVPAREILSLSEDELSSICQKIHLPEHISKRISDGLTRAIPELAEAAPKVADEPDVAQISNALFDAMDDVPSNWIVRSNIAGPSTLKAFAGAGVITEGDQGWSAGQDLEIGPGWVRHGNRRRIDATDARFVDTIVQGHKPRIHYLARPWMTAARRYEGPDPHRHGTPFAGKGSWPAEWRVFVEDGRITGVACYYGWAGSATPENAARALEAVALAERMIAQAKAQGLASRYCDLEIARKHSDTAGTQLGPSAREAVRRYPRDGINCTLDFIEVTGEDGTPVMMFLEGGPAHTPMGGGHPCAFAGHGVDRNIGAGSRCDGVALRLMDHVILADPATWHPGETEDRILSWEEARALAAQV